jgi:N-hydroxyarylamine O-acetyltransferase
MDQWFESYLARIGYVGSTKPSDTSLAQLHQSHMYKVPFENLDIQYGKALSLTLPDLVEKVVKNKRGGFCYEVNYLFANLLQAIGFQVSILSAKVYKEDGMPGQDYDHMTLLVVANESWLADVGFGGSSFISPLKFVENTLQCDVAGYYRITAISEADYLLYFSLDGTSFKALYEFSIIPRTIEEFHPQCLMKQQHPESHFVKNKICTLATIDGRKSIHNELFTIRNGETKEELLIEDQQMEADILEKHFDIKPMFLR